ncbi:hypothetical protein O181_054471 [Austropuccinia psidii MF-1]|uniref:Uncharacterized protein n=1 Tax=Austropuccinia psidii MF-1 TaxID=1389203 RepID=A0A9Q3E2L5_9BASI|nr:hypothetical protein [Austropuccinia psidii MF-1]
MDIKDKPKERMSELTKKKNCFPTFRSTEQYSKNCPKAKKKVYAIEQDPEEESPTENFGSDSMGDATREHSDDEQDPKRGIFSGVPRGNKTSYSGYTVGSRNYTRHCKESLCKHTQDVQTFLVTSTKLMSYTHATATKMTICIDNAQNPLIIDIGANCSIVEKEYLDNHFPNWEKQHLPT